MWGFSPVIKYIWGGAKFQPHASNVWDCRSPLIMQGYADPVRPYHSVPNLSNKAATNAVYHHSSISEVIRTSLPIPLAPTLKVLLTRQQFHITRINILLQR